MSYRINARAKKNGGYSWGLIFEDWQQGKRIDRRIKTHDLLQYGFRPDMSVEEARGRAKQLNAETKFKRRGEKDKIRALQSAELEKRFVSKHFPQPLVEEFERTRLKTKFEFGGDDPAKKYKKALSRWRFAREMVIKLDLLPSDWEEEPRLFYKYFSDKAISLDYAGKVIHVLNLWGHFISKKQGKAFLPTLERSDSLQTFYKNVSYVPSTGWKIKELPEAIYPLQLAIAEDLAFLRANYTFILPVEAANKIFGNIEDQNIEQYVGYSRNREGKLTHDISLAIENSDFLWRGMLAANTSVTQSDQADGSVSFKVELDTPCKYMVPLADLQSR